MTSFFKEKQFSNIDERGIICSRFEVKYSMSEVKRYRGLFNRYQRSKSIGKYILEDIRCFFEMIYLLGVNRLRQKRLLVYPHYPSKKASIFRIARDLNFFLSNHLKGRPDIAVYWEYKTHRDEFQALIDFCQARGIKILNLHSRDISKFYVDKVFESVFGYSSRIDPTTYQGPFVQKSDINAKHDGKIHAQPIKEAIDEGSIYQVLIDNSAGEGLVRDLRVPIFGREIPFVYEKFRPISERFLNTTVKTNLLNVEDAFSEDEVKKIIDFAQKSHLDHGELDILRDKNSGLIYIVDVNNTPQSPPANCSKETSRMARKLMKDAFYRNFLS